MKEVKRKGYRNYTFRYKKIQKDTCSISEGRLNMVSGKYNVNEVGLKVGYSTASHFIAAFKKKFGITPKKYLLSLSS